jgi:hypothetical protein
VGGGEGPARPAVHDRLAEAEGEVHDALLRLGRTHGIEVDGARDARQVRVEAVPVTAADDLLHDHRHPLGLRQLAGRPAVRPRLVEERRGEDELDRVHEALEAPRHVGLVARDHLGAVHPGEGPAERVLERARGPAGERHPGVLGQRPQVSEPLGGQGGPLERQGDHLVRRLILDRPPQAVAVEERVEDRRGHDTEGGHVEGEPGDLELRPPALQDPGGRHQAPGLAPERARPDPADAARRVEEPALEAGDVLARRDHTVRPTRGPGRPGPPG